MSATIQEKINNIDNFCITRKDYHDLLRECAKIRSCRACVYIYDTMKRNNIEYNQETYDILDTLHKKDLIDNDSLHVPNDGTRKLAPKRRIHKIMKGQITKHHYEKSLIHKESVMQFLNENPDIKHNPKRHWVAKQISKNCKIDVRTARYIITHLKRIKFIDSNHIPVIRTSIQKLDSTFFSNIPGSTIHLKKNNLPNIIEKEKIFQGIQTDTVSKDNISLNIEKPPKNKLPSIHKHIKVKSFGKSNIQNFF